jgi:hypothetical protein
MSTWTVEAISGGGVFGQFSLDGYNLSTRWLSACLVQVSEDRMREHIEGGVLGGNGHCVDVLRWALLY